MLSASTSPIPHICVSPPSPEKLFKEPSLFLSTTPGHDNGGYCSRFLSPKCHFSDMSPRYPSPLRPADCPPPRGLHRGQFESLLKASSDRRAALGSRKVPDLRKELAIKNQRNRHLERRALFLSRIREPALCTEVYTSKVTPESPDVIHCTLPSTGLELPLVSFESLANKRNDLIGGERPRRHVGFGQMDSLLPIGQPKVDLKSGRHNLPSLEEIIARVGQARLPPSMAHDPILTTSTPLPSIFLRSGKDAPPTRSVSDTRRDINIGRLHMPVRRRQSSNSLSDVRLSASTRCSTKFEMTTPAVPDTRSNAGYAHTEPNVHALGRASTAREMISTIKRRTSPPPGLPRDQDQFRLKRHSAPAEMQLRGRSGFEHPNLSLPGGF